MMTARKKTAGRNIAGDSEARSAKRSAFWGGVFDGFGGPMLMALKPRMPIPGRPKAGEMVFVQGRDIPAIQEYASWGRSQRRLARALMRASEKIAGKKGLVSYLAYEETAARHGK